MSGWREKAYTAKQRIQIAMVTRANSYVCAYTYTQNHFTFSPSLFTFFYYCFILCFFVAIIHVHCSLLPLTLRIELNYTTIQQKNENHIPLFKQSVPNQQLSLFCCFVRTFALASSSFTRFSYIPPLAL